MAEVGRPTDLTEELFRKIKQSILDGNDLRQTAKVCEMPESTLYTWHSDNYLNIRDKVERWKMQRKLDLADKNMEGILALGISDKDSLRVVADMTKFVKETLDKKNYSKQVNTDITSGGKQITGFNYVNPTDNQANPETAPSLGSDEGQQD